MERREFLSAMTAFGSLAPIASRRCATPRGEEYLGRGSAWINALGAGRLSGRRSHRVHRERGEGRADAPRSVRCPADEGYSWRNTTGTTKNVMVRARALAGDRELPPSKVEFISQDHLYVAFGRRGVPEKMADRHGSYPFEAVFVGFVTFA